MKPIITTIALLFISMIGFGQTTEFSKLDSFFEILEENDRFFGSVAVSRHGKVIYTKALGHADMEAGMPNNDETKLRIGSISKTFTATLIMKAVEMGKVDLDNTIEGYFPQVQNADRITVRQLLNHRSGITNFTDRSFFSWYTRPLAQTALLDTIVSKGVDFEPNTQHQYSNSNYVLLTFILEDIFNKTYTEVLDQYIIVPLDLKNTGYGDKIDPSQNEAKSYRMNQEWQVQPESHMSIPLGAGGIVSTPTDLCLFAEALFNGKLISTSSFEQMQPVDDESYGFALEHQTFDGMKGVGHGGDIDAFTSTLTYLPESELSFAVISNGPNYSKHDIAIAVLSEMTGKPYDLPSFELIELTSEELDQYVGTYETSELPMEFTINKEGNTLLLGVTGQSASPLKAEGSHKFSVMKYGVKITFAPEENTMHFEQNGMAFDMNLKQSPELVESETEDLDQYLGVYKSDELPMDLTISKEGDMLMGQGTGQPSFSLESDGDHTFVNQEIGLTMTFTPKDGTLQFEQNGMVFEMEVSVPEPVEPIKDNLDQYLGIYESNELPMDLTISKDGDTLMGQGTGQSAFTLKPDGDHTFSNQEIGLTITFTPDNKKLRFEQGAAAFEMKIEQ